MPQPVDAPARTDESFSYYGGNGQGAGRTSSEKKRLIRPLESILMVAFKISQEKTASYTGYSAEL